jgi:hypothetical protein
MIKRISLLLCLSIALPAIASGSYDLYILDDSGFVYEGTYSESEVAVVGDAYRRNGTVTQCYKDEALVFCPR